MADFTDAQIDEVIDAALGAGLVGDERRPLLFDGIDPYFVMSIPGASSAPLDRLRYDLISLRDAARDGQVEYLIEWLQNAARLSAPRIQSRVFRAMAEALGGGGASPRLAMSTRARPDEGEARVAPSGPSSDEPLFCWLHLSDIHFSHGDAHEQWDQKLVLDKIVRDFREFEGEGVPTPDKILVTGDLAYSGGANKNLEPGASEYGLTRAWLGDVSRALGLELTDIYMVPGNHDVNWAADKDPETWALVDGVRTQKTKLDNVLQMHEDRLFGRHAQYLEFAKDFAPPCALPFWHEDLRFGPLTVRLVGLDSALVAKSDDLGHLYLGLKQWATGIDGLAHDSLVIVLTHHPLRQGWLADEREMKNRIQTDAHIHLCGHVHEAESAESWRGSGDGHVKIIAGAAHAPEEERIFGHGYNIAAVYRGEDGKLELRVWPRKWFETTNDFRSDVSITKRGLAYASHRLDLANP